MFGAIVGIIKKNITKANTLVYPWDFKALIGSSTSITYSSNTTLTSRLIIGDTITINTGVTVTTMSGGVIIVCNKFVNNGILTASGKGAAGADAISILGQGADGTNGSLSYYGGSGGGGGSNSNEDSGGDGGDAHAGNGGSPGIANSTPGGDGADDFINIFSPTSLWQYILDGSPFGAGGGSGAGDGYGDSGAGGDGGGGILIVCMQFDNTGTISVSGIAGGNATSGRGAGGGGGGGMLLVDSQTITTRGTLVVTGGDGGTASVSARNGGDGGDGFALVMERWSTS